MACRIKFATRHKFLHVLLALFFLNRQQVDVDPLGMTVQTSPIRRAFGSFGTPQNGSPNHDLAVPRKGNISPFNMAQVVSSAFWTNNGWRFGHGNVSALSPVSGLPVIDHLR